MKYLIVTADDFGLTRSVNEGILRACREGIVTSVSVLPTGEAFEDAIRSAKAAGIKSVGAHLALTETTPVTDPRKIPTLVAKDNRFYKDYLRFFFKLFSKKIDHGQVYIELKGQLDRLITAGIPVTNLNSHEHIHMMPDILKIFVRLAKEYNIPSVRYLHGDILLSPFKIKKIYKAIVLSYFGGRMNSVLEGSGTARPDNFIGFLDSGDLNESILINMLNALGEGTAELVTHPGFLGPELLERYRFHLNCESELFALTSPRVKKTIKDKNIKLITYEELAAKR